MESSIRTVCLCKVLFTFSGQQIMPLISDKLRFTESVDIGGFY